MRIMITGPEGQVGWECRRSLQAIGEIVCAGRQRCDLQRPDSIRAAIRDLRPDLIVNTAAYTAVDRAETEADVAHAVNAVAPGVLAEELKRVGGALVHLSTDYVFDGAKATAYTETDACNPLSVYGRSKLAGERAVIASGVPALVLRTSWVYAMRGRNFARTILRLAAEREELRIVDDQWGAPTWARSIADGIAAIIARAGSDGRSVAASLSARGGVYHMTNAGRTNWYQFASAVVALHPDRPLKVRTIAPIPTSQYPTPARRPPNSSLDCARLAQVWSVALPPWQSALALAVADERATDTNGP